MDEEDEYDLKPMKDPYEEPMTKEILEDEIDFIPKYDAHV